MVHAARGAHHSQRYPLELLRHHGMPPHRTLSAATLTPHRVGESPTLAPCQAGSLVNAHRCAEDWTGSQEPASRTDADARGAVTSPRVRSMRCVAGSARSTCCCELAKQPARVADLIRPLSWAARPCGAIASSQKPVFQPFQNFQIDF
jgi:hypothetical protein